jgi:hypothetical protein
MDNAQKHNIFINLLSPQSCILAIASEFRFPPAFAAYYSTLKKAVDTFFRNVGLSPDARDRTLQHYVNVYTDWFANLVTPNEHLYVSPFLLYVCVSTCWHYLQSQLTEFY